MLTDAPRTARQLGALGDPGLLKPVVFPRLDFRGAFFRHMPSTPERRPESTLELTPESASEDMAGGVACRRMEIAVILICVFAIVGLTYMGAGAWLRDRERNRRHRE